MAISTLYDYYTSKGQALPSLSTRATLYSQYGLTGNYTGTAQQNTALLQKLLAGGTTSAPPTQPPPAAAPAPLAPAAAEQMGNIPTLTRLPDSNFDTGGANNLVNDSQSQTAATTAWLNANFPQQTADQKLADELTKKISEFQLQDVGQTQAQNLAEANLGVPGLQQQVAALNQQIDVKNALYNAQYNAILNPTDPNKMAILPVASSQAAAVQRQQAFEIGILQAQSLGLQGRIDTAQGIAKKAVDAKYATIEDTIKILQSQLTALQPTLDKQEKRQALELQMKYDAWKQEIADKKANETALYNLMVTPEGAAAKVLATDTLAQAAQKISSYLATAGKPSKLQVIGSHFDENGIKVEDYGFVDEVNKTVTPYTPSSAVGNVTFGLPVGSMFGLNTYNTKANNPGVVRAVRNNNPGNIKATATSVKYPGVIGIESTPADDGGNFLIFANPQSGQNAIGNILKLGIYSGLTAEQAIKKYNNNGTYGATDVGLDPKKNFQSQISNPSILQSVISNITRLEGYSTAASNNTGASQIVKDWAKRISEGTAKLSEAPQALHSQINSELTKSEYAQVNDLQTQARDEAKALLDMFNKSIGTSAVGGNIINRLGPIGDWLGQGTRRVKFINTFDRVKSLLALDGVKYLKGQGQVSDAERRLLAEAATKLSRNMSEGDFRDTLSGVIDTLNKKLKSASDSSEVLTAPQVGQPQVVEYPVGSGQLWDVDINGNMTAR